MNSAKIYLRFSNSSDLFYMLEEQNQMVQDLGPQAQSTAADGMVRALTHIYTDARATQRESMKSDGGVRQGFQEE